MIAGVFGLAVFFPYISGQLVADLRGSDAIRSILAGSEKKASIEKVGPVNLDTLLGSAATVAVTASSVTTSLLETPN